MNSLRTRLTLRLLLGGALLLGAAGAALYWQVSRTLTGQFEASLQTTAQALAGLVEQKHDAVKFEYSGENMPHFEQANGSGIFLVRTADGREIERSRSLGAAALPLPTGTAAAPAYFDYTMPDGRLFRCIGLSLNARVEEDDDEEDNRKRRRKPPQAVVLVAGEDRTPLDQPLAALRRNLLLVGAGALAALSALVRWEVRSGLRPLNALTEQVAAVDAKSLAARFPVEPLPMELRPVAARLNELLARLESAFARERRFTATAAHELRTPLAELRALAEVNLTTPASAAEVHESWSDALATTLRMESLALRLLELARAEDSARVVQSEPVEIAPAIDAAWAPWAARARERHLTREVSLPDGLTVKSDPALLQVILANLTANAVEHATAGATFAITATPAPGGRILRFRNRADQLTTEDLPRLFERFWRKEASRTDHRHHGLGLALAADFAALLGGSLTAQAPAAGELEITLQLPAES
jgi:two-component system sensor histidine kinase QseC